MAPTPPLLFALSQAAIKRRLLGKAPADRLVEYGISCGVTDPASLRAWLGKADGLHPELARKLLALVPPADQRPLGDYLPLAHLADGGMGSVWLATRTGQDELVVVKTIKGSSGQTEANADDAVRRFDREARITRSLTHRNVVRCIDNGVADQNTMYLVLEYVDSGDLRDLVDAKGGLSEALMLAIMYQVVDGLAEAHRVKLIHRDIKPPNIFVSSTGLAKLADFGIARSTETTRTMLTMEGAIVGSPLYMSPEQILTDPTLDIRSDIYAIGAVMYFCLTAQPPYSGKLQEILHQHCSGPVPDARKVRPAISDAVQGLIEKAMAKDRKQRFQTPEDLRTAIGSVLKNLGLAPGAVRDESTALHDLADGTAKAVALDMASATALLRSAEGLDDMPTIADAQWAAGKDADAHLATVTADLRGAGDSADLATMAANLGTEDLPTMAANLGAGDSDDMPTIATDLRGAAHRDPESMATLQSPIPRDEMATMTAVLLAMDIPPLVPPENRVGAGEPGTGATVRMDDLGTVARILAGKDAPAAAALAIDGDLATALAAPWIVLSATAPDPTLVFLFAQREVRMGKLREAPVDLCLRNYPVMVHKDACQRISRSHCALRYDAIGRQALLADLNAPNGTRLDGIPVPAGGAVPLGTGIDNILDLAGVVVLWLRCLARSGAAVPPLAGYPAGTVGLDTDCALDAVAMTRPENRSEMAYAQVLRRLTIGGPGAGLPLAGARSQAACELAVIGGRWIWRPAAAAGKTPGPWSPLVDGTELDCGGRKLRAAPGKHELYG